MYIHTHPHSYLSILRIHAQVNIYNHISKNVANAHTSTLTHILQHKHTITSTHTHRQIGPCVDPTPCYKNAYHPFSDFSPSANSSS